MADKKDELEGFKIGDAHRAGMSKPAARAGADAPVESDQSSSLGFTRIENLLEKEDPVLVGEGLSNLLKNLEELEAGASTNKDRAAAQKAIGAVERAVDLMDYLFQTKSALESNAE